MAATHPPFLLIGRDEAWHVVSGGADVFLVDIRDGEPSGARRHVLRAGEGETLFGLDAGSHAKAGLLACPLPGAVIEARSRLDAGLAPMESWIENMTRVLSGSAAPQAAVALEIGPENCADDEPRLFRSAGALCWVSHHNGGSAFLGIDELPSLNGDQWFPLAPGAWLRTDAGSRLAAIGSHDWMDRDPRALGLDEFHRVAMEALVVARSRADRKERDRLAAAAGKDAAQVETALRQLAAPLQEEAEEFEGVTGESPLLVACRVVGRALGIEIKAPRGMKATDGVEAIARASGVRVRRVALRGEWWKDNSGPMVAFRDEDRRPMALRRRTGGYELWDPVERRSTRVGRTAAGTLQAFAWVFYRPFPARKLNAADLVLFGLRGAGLDLAAIIGMGVASGILATLTPVATGLIFDKIVPGSDRAGLIAVSGFLVVSALASALFQLTRNFALVRLESRMDASVQAAVWDRLLALPVPFFRDFTAGDLAMRSLGISQMRRALTGTALSSILSGIFSIFSFALMFYYSWRLAWIGVLLTAVAVVLPLALGYLKVVQQRGLSEIRGRISGMVLQFLHGIGKLRVTGKEVRAFTAWAREFTQQKQMAMGARKVSIALAVFLSVFPMACSGVIFYANTAELTTGSFLAFYAAFFQFMSASLALSWSAVSVLEIVPLFERARPILETLPESDATKAEPGELSGNIEVSHVFFRYRTDAPLVLRGLSLRIGAGEFVAMVGGSGCGKSTLFRMLLGFERPESGAIYYDGQDLAGLHMQAVRRQIGVVLQNGKLQTGDIFQNIIGALPLSIDDAWAAARMAGFDQDIQAMPMGMHTVISEGGGGLSGGQRQRLMIARAIAGKPRILLFDEATSALDNQTQAIVSRSLESLRATRVVIAHRLSTIQHADRIYFIEGGVVAESGTYEELMRQDGLFAKLAKRQLA